jgi:thiol:disulfide interchange protein DsbA
MSNLLRAIIVLLATASLQLALAQAPARNAPYLELNPPQPTEAGGKIEVIEFFWYGCPHCYAFEPVLNPWIKKLPKDVVFRRVPAIFNEQWGVAARVYYTLEALGETARLHTALFDAIHKDNLRITDESAMAAWLGKNGVNVDKYKAAYRSFGVETHLKRALQMTNAYRIDGVPAMAVQGRYVLSASVITDRQELLNATEQVIRMALKQSGSAPAKGPAAKSGAK